MYEEKDVELEHYGMPRRSGRYKWGSGEVPYQHEAWFTWRVKELKKAGMSEKEIAESAHMSVRELRARISAASDVVKQNNIRSTIALREKGYSPKAIAKRLNIPYTTVTGYLKQDALEKRGKLMQTVNELKAIVDEKGYVDVGKSSEYDLGVSRERLLNALQVLKDEGYYNKNIYVDQGSGAGTKKTTTLVLAKPGTTTSEVYDNIDKVAMPGEIAVKENGKNALGIQYPKSISSDRVYVKYAEEGGKDRDGLIQLRRGVEDISLGNGTYSQVRIAVDDKKFLKGMAIYGDDKDIPDGYDIVFNTNKTKAEYPNKLDTLKDLKADKDNPFGATIKKNGQRTYVDEDGNEQLSVINKVNEEEDWNKWSKTLSAQFLSKQPVKLIKAQLDKTFEDHEKEFNEIQDTTNPVLKRELLEEFASKCDSDAVTLKAAALPRQSQAVLLPITNIADDQVYAPRYENGEKLALVRYPHAGTFEIPIVTVNNNNPEGIKTVGPEAFTAIGISAKTAAKLSGADFDGDTATVLPMSSKEGALIRSSTLKDLEGFETSSWPNSPNAPKVDKKNFNKGMEMGKASNLITDMTVKGASDEELVRAVKYSMVVIDAEKHNLDWKGAYAEYGIAELKTIYQGGARKGASTLISKAAADERIPVEKDYQLVIDPKTGKSHVEKYNSITGEKLTTPTGETYIKRTVGIKNIDPKTGKSHTDTKTVYSSQEYNGHKVYSTKEGTMVYTNDDGNRVNIPDSDIDKIKTKYFYKSGKKEVTYLTDEQVAKMKTKEIPRTQKTTKMAVALSKGDAHLLSSGTDVENAYADYANRLYALANETRRAYNNTPVYKRDATAARTYKDEVTSLQKKVQEAKKNEPIERMAERATTAYMRALREDNPDLSFDEIKKYRAQKMNAERERLNPNGRYKINPTEKEWEAIQAHAVSPDFFKQILRYSDKDYIRKLSSGRKDEVISDVQLARAKALLAQGHTWSDIAADLGVSQTTIYNKLHE